MREDIKELNGRLAEISHLGSACALLSWDQETYMPPEGADFRAEAMSHLSALVHNKLVSIDNDGLLTKLNKRLKAKKLNGSGAVIVRETWRTYEREKKLSEEFVRELSETCSKAHTVWIKARHHNDFKLFRPWLEKIVKLKRKEAEMVGYASEPYDALLDLYEPGMTARETEDVFAGFKSFLVPFLKKIQGSKVKITPSILKGEYPIEAQKKFNEYLSRSLGFDFAKGRLDRSVHPFASGLNPHDVRLTTRYKKDDIFHSLSSTIHETGHGLYDQGLPAEYFGTPLSEAVSLGIHESQSRMWENIIGKSLPFWRYFYPKLQKEFPKPFKKISLDRFHKAINCVKPSLIRTESDEVTYNIHIIIRFEIERAMLEGKIKVADLPRIWKTRMKEYLGIEVPDDARGVLQDVHWSWGNIGYFPTYSLGNLYSAQFFAKIRKDIPGLNRKISKGDFKSVLSWLRKNIHSKGKIYRASELVKKVTGEKLDSRYFNEYLREKYGEIYGIN